jgi:hypothetical protein
MNAKDKVKILSEEEIDEIVEQRADDDSAWEEPICVKWTKLSLALLPFPVSLPLELAERAAFFAQSYKEPSTEEWLTRIIQERMDSEAAFMACLGCSNLSLPSGFAELVRFFAEWHQQPDAKVWVAHVIEERIKSEEAIFSKLKRDLMAKR